MLRLTTFEEQNDGRMRYDDEVSHRTTVVYEETQGE